MPKRKQTDGDSTVSPDPGEIKALIGRVKQSDLAERDAQRIGRLLRLVLTLVSMREHKNASIARLKRLLFGPRSGKRGRRDALSPPDAGDATAHKPARIYYSLEKQGREYEERRGAEAYEQREREQVLANVRRRARGLGYELVEQVA